MSLHVRLSFRDVATRKMTKAERSLNDLSDDVLSRVFALVLGPLKRAEHYINNGILVRHAYMEPTMVSNFDDILVLTMVCKRWQDIIDTSLDLWRHVHVSADLLRIPRKTSGWMKMFMWLSSHAHKMESLHFADESAIIDGSLDSMKMGALSLLCKDLRVLHLDHCFYRGTNADMLAILSLCKKLEQLQVSSVTHDFISQIHLLSELPFLRRLHIQGSGDYWDGHCPVLVLKSTVLPDCLEVLSLANVRVRGFCQEADMTGTPLYRLLVLELVYVEWVGPFVSTIAKHISLRKLFVTDCDKVVIDTIQQPNESNWSDLASCERLETFVLKNGRYGDFCRHLSRDFSGISCLSRLKELELCPDHDTSAQFPYSFDDRFSKLFRLLRLNLTNVGFMELPPPVAGRSSLKQKLCLIDFLGLSSLEDLDVTGNKLTMLPNDTAFVHCLQRLVLDSNAFAEIPDLSRYLSLTVLQISNNPLKFSKDCDYLASLPSLRVLRLGNRRLLDVFPIFSASQVDDICKDLRLCPVGGFHLGSLCSSLRYRNPKCRLLM